MQILFDDFGAAEAAGHHDLDLPRPPRNGLDRLRRCAIAAALTQRGVIVSPRVGSTRFSADFYNSSHDIGHTLATLDKVLR